MGGWKIFRLPNSVSCSKNCVYIHVQLCFVYTAAFLGLPQSGKNQEQTNIFHDQGKVSELFS